MREHAPVAYRLGKEIARRGWRRFAGLDVRGLENIPREGPCLIIANHESNLDPILIQAVCPRPVHGMAKSSQFRAPLLGPLMPHLLAFPVRRYQPDPQAVRTVLRLLGRGRVVAVYIEGERCWDGRLQDPRPGTIRLILKAGVPVVPCGISGSYEAWPRWAFRPQLLPIRITFGEVMRFPKLDRRADREERLAPVSASLMAELARLSSGDLSPADRASVRGGERA